VLLYSLEIDGYNVVGHVWITLNKHYLNDFVSLDRVGRHRKSFVLPLEQMSDALVKMSFQMGALISYLESCVYNCSHKPGCPFSSELSLP
jgi:hypothetical protein